MFDFSFAGSKIVAIDMRADPQRIRQLEVKVLEG
jgi:hypothetical protein